MSNALLVPSIVDVRALKPNVSRVTVEPLERGFGHTLGNALRRVMMSSVPGFAATEVKIEGVMHECDRVDGMREEVIWLILNLKNVIFRLNDSDREVVRVVKEGPCTVVAGDIQLSQKVDVVNPDAVLATLTKGGKLDMEITVESGAGYQPAPVDRESRRVGVILLDASFCPVRRMNFTVGSTRHGDRVDLDRLVMEIETNGVFSCEGLVREASNILIKQFHALHGVRDTGDDYVAIDSVGRHREAVTQPELSQSVDALELSVRSRNCLKQEGISYIGELVQKTEKDMMETPNFGRKSLMEIKAALGRMGLDIGMELPGWKSPR